MCGFPVNFISETSVLSCHGNIQEADPVVFFPLHGKLDLRMVVVEMLVECFPFVLAMCPDDKYIIHISCPEVWCCQGCC